jgi:protein SCO1/2
VSRAVLLATLLLLSACAAFGSGVAEGGGARQPLFDPSWVFRDEAGREVRPANLGGEPAVVTAFFTSCQTRCPLTIRKLRKMDASFHRRGRTMAFLLVTLDPATDTPERLARFKRSNDLPDNWHLLTGNDEDTKRLARALAVNPLRDEGHIDHDVRIAVLDAQGRVVKSFGGWDFDEDAIVAAME